MNFLLCQNGIVLFCLNNAQDNERLAVWARGSFDSIICNSFNIRDIHQVSVSEDTLIDIILCCLHWWRKQKRQHNIFLFTLSDANAVFQWSNLVNSRTTLEPPRSSLQGRRLNYPTQVSLSPFSWDFISEGEDLGCPFACIFTTFFCTVSAVILYHIPSRLQIASLASTKTFKELQPS